MVEQYDEELHYPGERGAAEVGEEFRLVMAIQKFGGVLSRPFFRKYAESYGVSLNAWRVIVHLARNPATASQDMSVALGLQPMNISRAVAELREQSFVSESRDPENHRRILLRLTPVGRAVFDSLYPIADARARALFAGLTSEEFDDFTRLLRKVILYANDVIQDEEK